MADIISWNCNGFYSNYENFQYLNSYYKPHIFCIQETHFKTNFSPLLHNYTSYSTWPTTNITAHGGVTTIVSNNIYSVRLPIQTTLQIVAIRAHFGHQATTIVNVYLPPNEPIPEADFLKVFNQLPPPFIVLGDFNGHHTYWGATRTNSHG